MGHTFAGKCKQCGEQSTFSVGGGFFFHQLNCDRCHKTKTISFDKMGDLHARYVKGLPGPWTIATMEQDKWIQEHAPIEPLSEEEYYRAIGELVGKCKCGGQFTMKAPPRCPKCKSADIEHLWDEIYYD